MNDLTRENKVDDIKSPGTKFQHFYRLSLASNSFTKCHIYMISHECLLNKQTLASAMRDSNNLSRIHRCYESPIMGGDTSHRIIHKYIYPTVSF